MNVSANNLLVPAPHTPVCCGSDILNVSKFLLVFGFARFSDSSLDISDSPFGVFRESSTESLILAQDERWRRA